MEASKNKSSSRTSAIGWAARILCILFIALLSMFSFDVFEEGTGLGREILGFLVHNIPSFVLIICLVIAWKHALVGGVMITLAGLAASAFVYSLNYGRSHSVSTGLRTAALLGAPFVIVGILFMISHFLRRPRTLAAQTP